MYQKKFIKIDKKMKKIKEYPTKAIFPSRKTLEDYIRNYNLQKDGTILLFCSNINGYESKYDPKTDKIILYLTGQTKEELTESNLKFFRFADNYFRWN